MLYLKDVYCNRISNLIFEMCITKVYTKRGTQNLSSFEKLTQHITNTLHDILLYNTTQNKLSMCWRTSVRDGAKSQYAHQLPFKTLPRPTLFYIFTNLCCFYKPLFDRYGSDIEKAVFMDKFTV